MLDVKREPLFPSAFKDTAAQCCCRSLRLFGPPPAAAAAAADVTSCAAADADGQRDTTRSW